MQLTDLYHSYLLRDNRYLKGMQYITIKRSRRHYTNLRNLIEVTNKNTKYLYNKSFTITYYFIRLRNYLQTT
jgi:hypothetical protein